MSPARSQRSFCGLTNPMFDLPPSPANPTTPMGPRSLHNLQSSASRPTSVASHVRPTSVSAQHRVVMPQGSPQEPSALASPGFRPTSVSAQYRVAVPLAPSSDSALSSPGAARPVRVSAQHRTAMPLSTDAALASPGALGRSRGRRSSVDMFGLQVRCHRHAYRVHTACAPSMHSRLCTCVKKIVPKTTCLCCMVHAGCTGVGTWCHGHANRHHHQPVNHPDQTWLRGLHRHVPV